MPSSISVPTGSEALRRDAFGEQSGRAPHRRGRDSRALRAAEGRVSSPRLRARMPVALGLVVGIEAVVEVVGERPIAGQMLAQDEGLVEPGRVREVPLGGARVVHGLDGLVLVAQGHGERQRQRPAVAQAGFEIWLARDLLRIGWSASTDGDESMRASREFNARPAAARTALGRLAITISKRFSVRSGCEIWLARIAECRRGATTDVTKPWRLSGPAGRKSRPRPCVWPTQALHWGRIAGLYLTRCAHRRNPAQRRADRSIDLSRPRDTVSLACVSRSLARAA